MKIPETLKIGGHMYDVLVVPGEILDGDCGETEIDKSIIRINGDMPQSQQEETLLHEVIHAVDFNMSEEDVYMFSMALYQVLKDNSINFNK